MLRVGVRVRARATWSPFCHRRWAVVVVVVVVVVVLVVLVVLGLGAAIDGGQ